ncbi:hypothetical protein RMSM_07773 [Rhodopirellula maiorica SM1]|uniref:Uncharacterized protein n=2 Tax=Novipirellula TaxID=2795426 RepID=M5RIX6_9BACT|nr:hypothetical protein RMSM_07773 [Rhodopirellula maiorica SM1]
MFLVTTVFISGLRGEWFFWWHALALGFSVVYSDEAIMASEIESEDNILETYDPEVDRIYESNFSMTDI